MLKIGLFKNIWKQITFVLNRKQKSRSGFILILLIIGSILEMLSVSLVIPFVQAILEPNKLMNNIFISYLIELFDINGEIQFLIVLGIFLIFVYLTKNAFLIFSSYWRIRFQCQVQKEMSVEIMKSCMSRDYLFHINTNSGELIRKTHNDVMGVYYLLSNVFKLIAETLTTVAVGVFIMYTDLSMALFIFLLAGSTLIIFTVGIRHKMKRLGKDNMKYSALVYQHMLQGYAGIKEIMVMRRQNFFLKNYEQAYQEKSRTEIGQVFASEVPAFIIEAVCVGGLIGVICFRIGLGIEPTQFVPQLAAFAVAAFRILPSTARIIGAFNAIVFYQSSLESTYQTMTEVKEYKRNRQKEYVPQTELAEEGSRQKDKKKFNQRVSIEQIYWKYPNTDNYVLENLSLIIEKGKSIALIGESGAGKSTLADVILGLFPPEQGSVDMDGINIQTIPHLWARTIGYVPQGTFLSDDTIRANVAFGIESSKIDEDMVWNALEQSQIREFVENLPDGLDTILGERGIKFSGGQRQRVAIARALYYNPDILVLDEATSALDTETEKAVMDAIDSLQGQKTLIIVAHRLTTIKNCDEIYEIVGGKAILRKKNEVIA